MQKPQLLHLRRKSAYYNHDAPEWVRNIWDRPQGFNWFVKSHRDELVADGALVKLGRDFFVDAERFPLVAERILGVSQGEPA